MHNLLRMFVNAAALLLEATDQQLDQRGAKKAVASIWSQLPMMSNEVLQCAEELMDDPSRSIHLPHENERKWLKALIDELGAPSDRPQLTADDSWKSITHGVAWFAFCLREASSYAKDEEYGAAGFRQVCEMLQSMDSEEQAVVVAGVTEASVQFDRSEVRQPRITEAYDELLSYATKQG